MITKVALLAGISLSLCVPSAMADVGKPGAIFPAELRGNWYEADNYAAPICDNEDLGLLQVEEKEFVFPLAIGRLIRIVEQPIDTYSLSFFEQAVTDGPDVPPINKRKQMWTLSHDGEHLNIVAKGMTLDLFRCQAQPSE